MAGELPPEFSLRRESAEPPAAEEWDDLEVRVDRPSNGSVDRRPPERLALLACALVATLALVVLAWSSWSTARSSAQQVCMQKAQSVAFMPGNFSSDGEQEAAGEIRAAFAECGVELPEPSDDGDSSSGEG